MRIKECKEWDKLPVEIREILLENQKLINQHLLELEDEKDVGDFERCNHSRKTPNHKGLPNSKFSSLDILIKAKKKAGVRQDANIE